MSRLAKAVLGPWRVQVKKMHSEERWRVVVEVDVGHCVMRRSDYFASLEDAETAAEARRKELGQSLIASAWARSVAAFQAARVEEKEEH